VTLFLQICHDRILQGHGERIGGNDYFHGFVYAMNAGTRWLSAHRGGLIPTSQTASGTVPAVNATHPAGRLY